MFIVVLSVNELCLLSGYSSAKWSKSTRHHAGYFERNRHGD